MKKTKIATDYSKFITKLNSARNFLSSTGTELTITDDGSCHNSRGTEICNFFILPSSVSVQYTPNGQKKDDIFNFQILNCRHCAKITISLSELSEHKWIKNVNGGFFLRKSSDYSYIFSIISAMAGSSDDKTPSFACTGFHHIGNRWYYASSNLTIRSDKLDWRQRMLHADCHSCKEACSQCRYRLNSSLEGTAVPDRDKAQSVIISVITALGKNPRTALPIFMTSLLSSVSSVLSPEGLSTPLTLWITGKPGSGKTQLALYLGSFYNKPETRNDAILVKNYLRANESTKYIKERIAKSHDNIVILDDIKAENSTSLREHTNTNIDTLIRSIYDHNLSGTSIYSNAIITGEYRPDSDSTLARIILLPLKNFQESPENLQTLSFFQENGYLLADFMVLFLQWVCRKLENRNFLPALKKEKERLTEGYISETFSARNSEILSTLRLGLSLLEDFCCKYTFPSFKTTISSLITEGEDQIKELVKYTAYLHEDCSMPYAEALCNLILSDKSIRSAPEVYYNRKLNYFNYCISNDESGIYIKSPAVFSQKEYFKNPSHSQPYLLVKTELLEDFHYTLEDYCRRHGIPSDVYKRFNLRCLVQHKFILQSYNRSDGYANNILQYPYADTAKREMSLRNFYCINLDHPLLKTLKEGLSKRAPKPSPAFHEMSESDFALEYENCYQGDEDCYWDDEDCYEPETCEIRNYHDYRRRSNRYELNDFQNIFQNIFDYRHLKN